MDQSDEINSILNNEQFKLDLSLEVIKLQIIQFCLSKNYSDDFIKKIDENIRPNCQEFFNKDQLIVSNKFYTFKFISSDSYNIHNLLSKDMEDIINVKKTYNYMINSLIESYEIIYKHIDIPDLPKLGYNKNTGEFALDESFKFKIGVDIIKH